MNILNRKTYPLSGPLHVGEKEGKGETWNLRCCFKLDSGSELQFHHFWSSAPRLPRRCWPCCISIYQLVMVPLTLSLSQPKRDSFQERKVKKEERGSTRKCPQSQILPGAEQGQDRPRKWQKWVWISEQRKTEECYHIFAVRMSDSILVCRNLIFKYWQLTGKKKNNPAEKCWGVKKKPFTWIWPAAASWWPLNQQFFLCKGWWIKANPLPLSVNTVVLEHSHAHCFYVLSAVTCALQWQNWVIWPMKPKIFTIWPFTES